MVTLLPLLLLACTPTDEAGRPDTDGEETGGPDTDDSAPPDDTGPDDTGGPDGPDLDGDGFSPERGDCDDGDARVYPGAPDACDALDQDCDGEARPEGSCGELVPLEDGAVGWWEGEAQLTMLDLREADTDYTGDGVVDVLAGTYCTWLDGANRCNQNVVLLPGHIPDEGVSWRDAGAAVWIAEPGLDYTVDFGNAGDFDGDGSVDLFVTSVGLAPDQGSLYLMLGPSSRWSITGAYMADAADGWWQQAAYNDGFGTDAAGGHDVDGDGLADLLVLTTGTDEAGFEGRALGFVRGRAATLPHGAVISDETWFEDDVYASSFATLPDLDGDGIGEAAIAVPYTGEEPALGFVPSETLRTGASGLSLSAAVERTESDVISGFRLYEGRSELGDVDRDGYTDLAFMVARDVTGDGLADPCATSLRGAEDLRTGDLDDRIGGLACYDGKDFRYAAGEKLTEDVDGDSIPDVLWNDPYSAASGYLGCIIPSSHVPDSGVVMIEEIHPYCYGIGDNEGVGGGVIDLDGDGLPEILGSQPDWDRGDERYVGRILVAPGFEIPWDDATRW